MTNTEKSMARTRRAYWRAQRVLGAREPANPHSATSKQWELTQDARRLVEHLHREVLEWERILEEENQDA